MKYLVPILMLLVFVGIMTAADIYLTNRLAWIFSIENKHWLYILFGILPLIMFPSMLFLANTTRMVTSFLYIIISITVGVMLYLILSMLLVEVLNLFMDLKPAIFGMIAIGLTIVVSVYGIINAASTEASQQEISMPGLIKEIKIMHLSDIHLGHFRGVKYLDSLVEKTLAMEPDLVAITGDLFDGRKQMKPEVLEPLKKLKVPVYFIAGNHDGYSGIGKIKKMLGEKGIRVLENEVVRSGALQIVGLEHMRADDGGRSVHASPEGKTIREVLSELTIESDTITILLHHSPDGIKYAREAGINLYLAGHTHGGQLFPVTFLNDLLFKYNRGLYQYNGMQIYVSRGAGTFGPPMRVGTRSEITLIRLVG